MLDQLAGAGKTREGQAVALGRQATKLRRKRHNSYDRRGRLSGKRHISERPASVETRRRMGHWEIDTVVGGGAKDCVVTLVERKTGFAMIGKLADRSADGEAIIDPQSGARLVRPARVVRDASGQAVLDEEGAPRLEAIEAMRLETRAGGQQIWVDDKTGTPILKEETLFGRLARATRQAMLASMIAYLVAQLVDVWLFHFWRRLTKGRHLWLRNNGSTLVSQLVDTVCVVGITFWGAIASGEVGAPQVLRWIAGGYAFKFAVALLDTLPFYAGVHFLRRYLSIDDETESAG